MRRIGSTTLLLVLLILPILMIGGLLIGAALAAPAVPDFEPPSTPGDLFGTAEVLYALLVLPLVQFLKSHRPFSALFDALGENRRYGVIGLSIVVGVVLGLLAQTTGIFDYGGPRAAVMFGISAGIVGSGLKQILVAQRKPALPAGVSDGS